MPLDAEGVRGSGCDRLRSSMSVDAGGGGVASDRLRSSMRWIPGVAEGRSVTGYAPPCRWMPGVAEGRAVAGSDPPCRWMPGLLKDHTLPTRTLLSGLLRWQCVHYFLQR
jgi:hypothetical protein